MAHNNIFERWKYVERLIEKYGYRIPVAEKKIAAEIFGCSQNAIFRDVLKLTRTEKLSPFVSSAMKKRVFERDGMVCQYCGETDGDMIVEHVIPAAIGGVAKEYNLVIACNLCNVRKGRSVWIPKNLEVITENNPEWAKKIIELSKVFTTRIAPMEVYDETCGRAAAQGRKRSSRGNFS